MNKEIIIDILKEKGYIVDSNIYESSLIIKSKLGIEKTYEWKKSI